MKWITKDRASAETVFFHIIPLLVFVSKSVIGESPVISDDLYKPIVGFATVYTLHITPFFAIGFVWK